MRALLFATLCLTLVSGCAEEPPTYQLSGGFTHEPTEGEQLRFSHALEGADHVEWLLSYPPGFAASGMTLAECEASRQAVEALPFVAHVGPCTLE